MLRRYTDDWAANYDLERLVQLRADVESALNRYMTECVRAAALGTADDEERWMRTAGNAEQTRDWMLRDLDKWITERCKEQKGPGC